MSKRNFNPYREAMKYLQKTHQPIGTQQKYKYHSMHAALSAVAIFSARTLQQRKLGHKALGHYQDMLYPHMTELRWLSLNVLNDGLPDRQDLQDWRNRWMAKLAKDWDKGKIK